MELDKYTPWRSQSQDMELAALIGAFHGRTAHLSNDELADAMGVSRGESSKRVAKYAHVVHSWRDGKRKVIELVPGVAVLIAGLIDARKKCLT